MSRIRGNNKYVTAGIRSVPNQFAQVRGNVRLPGGDVNERIHEDVFSAQDSGLRARRRGPLLMSTKLAAFILVLIIAVFGFIIGGKEIARQSIASDINGINESLDQLIAENADNQKQVNEARDPAKVCYLAVNIHGMVNSLGQEAVYITLDGYGGYTAQRSINGYGLQAANTMQ